jgi:hypothetical protein
MAWPSCAAGEALYLHTTTSFHWLIVHTEALGSKLFVKKTVLFSEVRNDISLLVHPTGEGNHEHSKGIQSQTEWSALHFAAFQQAAIAPPTPRNYRGAHSGELLPENWPS